MAAHYLNVDLEIEGTRQLSHILQEFSESGFSCLGCFETRRGHLANFEVTALPSDPNSIVAEFCDAIESFREDAKASWAGAHRRTFDVGFDSDGSAGCSRFELKADTVRRAAELGASLGITIYRLSDMPEFGRPRGMRRPGMAARFIGVQLEVESPRPLGHLFHSFSGAQVVSVDYRESARGFAAAFEHAGRGVSTDPDIQIADFCDKITGFKDDAQSVWNGAYRRTFNVGYEIDDSSECFRSELAPETMERIARVGASVIVAIYPRGSEEPASEG